MPIYEFICQDCEKRYERLVRSGGSAPCPHCNSENVRKLMSGFAFRSKAADGSVTASSGGKCSGCSSSSCAGCH